MIKRGWCIIGGFKTINEESMPSSYLMEKVSWLKSYHTSRVVWEHRMWRRWVLSKWMASELVEMLRNRPAVNLHEGHEAWNEKIWNQSPLHAIEQIKEVVFWRSTRHQCYMFKKLPKYAMIMHLTNSGSVWWHCKLSGIPCRHVMGITYNWERFEEYTNATYSKDAYMRAYIYSINQLVYCDIWLNDLDVNPNNMLPPTYRR